MGIAEILRGLFGGASGDSRFGEPLSSLDEKFATALQDLRACPDYNFLTATTANGRSFQVLHNEGRSWSLNLLAEDPTHLNEMLMSGVCNGLQVEEGMENAILFSVEAEIPKMAQLCGRVASLQDPHATENHPSIDVYCADRDPKKARKPDVLSIVGSLLAKEAKNLALFGPNSAYAAIRALEYPKSRSEQDERFSLYVMHLAAFVETTMAYGADGLSIQAAMLNEAPRLAAEILGAPTDDPSTLREIRRSITKETEHYLALSPASGTDAGALRLGQFAAAQVLGYNEKDPYIAIAFLQVYRAAETASTDLIAGMAKSLRGSRDGERT